MGAVRDVVLSELPVRGISIQTTADGDGSITIVPSDSGVIFVNKYTTGLTTYTLPTATAAKGKWFWFYNAQTSQAIKLLAADTTMVAGGQAAYDYVTSAADTGACGFVFSDGSKFFFVEIAAAWTAYS